MLTAERYHDISCGHRVVGHESRCRHLHGHNYRVTFVCIASPVITDGWGDLVEDETHDEDGLDEVGRVIDFSVIKEKLCMWLEDNWDHKFLAWDEDSVMEQIRYAMEDCSDYATVEESIVWTPFNPTAENMAKYLVEVIGPQQLAGTGVSLASVNVQETRKCSSTYIKETSGA
jgi:6-pyruvoyltetrahydropterin/6-carboxytetrahydropterin synthase